MAIRASHFAMIRPFAYHLRRGFRSNSSIIGDKSKSARPNKNYIHRSLSVSDRSIDDSLQDNKRRGRRVWKAREESDFNIRLDHPASIGMPPKLWYKAVDDGDHQMVHESLLRICDQVRLIWKCSCSMFSSNKSNETDYSLYSIISRREKGVECRLAI